MGKVVTMGEILLRLSPAGNDRFMQAEGFDAYYGGAEANAAVAMAQMQEDVEFITKVPAHEMGGAAISMLRKYGVGMTHVARGGNRLGIYFCEQGTGVRTSKVIYDRAGSSIAEALPEDFDFDAIMSEADWFHWSGITPALSPRAAKLTEAACIAAKKHNVTVSCDVNYRGKLWTPEEAQKVMVPLMQYVDVCITNEDDAENGLGYKAENDTDEDSVKIFLQKVQEKFGFRSVMTTLLKSDGLAECQLRGILYTDGKFYTVPEWYTVHPVVGRIGAGDALAGALIHAMRTYDDPAYMVEFACAACALKMTVPGDLLFASEEEIAALIEGRGSGRTQR